MQHLSALIAILHCTAYILKNKKILVDFLAQYTFVPPGGNKYT